MSIYSGFATRRDQSRYNDLLSKLITMLQQHLIQVVRSSGGQLLNKKIVGYAKIVSKMREYEEHKYLPPKFSQLLDPLCRELGIGGSIPIPVAVEEIALQEKQKPALQKLKNGYSSTKHTKPKTRLQQQSFQIGRNKKASLYDELRSEYSQSRNVKKPLFDSHSELKDQLKERKLNPNVSREKVDVANTYEEEQTLRKNYQSGKEENVISTSNPILMSSKMKSNLRYRAYHAMNQAQENILKRNGPPPIRSQMRRKLKTTQDYSGDNEL